MNTLDQALALAARGIPVFPCLDTKAPAVAGGFKSATTDPNDIRALFANPAAVLIGVPTGAASGLDVLDLDPRHGSDAWWNANQKRIPATLIHDTRSGGKHLVFMHQPGLRSSAGRLAPGCDVRADGAYVIHWPSAGCQVWLDFEPQPWPVWLLAGLATRPTTTEPRGLASIAPPSAAAVVALLATLPNPLSATRDTYAQVMLAASGCAKTVVSDDDGTISAAAVSWAERWEGGSEQDEQAKWDSDWSRRDPVSGWQTLLRVARTLTPGYVDPTAGREFEPLPPLPVETRPARRRVLAPGECEGVTSRPYRVKGLLADRDVGCLFGPPGAGKSLLAPLLAYKLAQGEPFFGLRTRPGPTLYVAAEDESGMERRVNALWLAHGDAAGFGLVKGVCDLLNPSSGDMAWLLAEVDARTPALIVIDTLAMAFPGLIENDADGMGRVVAAARRLTEHGAAVLLVHHDSKARDGTPRGHSLLNGALDVAIALEPKDSAGVVRARLTKNRNGSCEHDMAFRIGVRVLGADQDGDPITAAIAVELSAADAGVRPQKLSDLESAALEMLKACQADSPDSVQGVTEDAWLDRCLALSTAATPDSRIKAARRMRSGLTQKGFVWNENGMVGVATPAGVSVIHQSSYNQAQGVDIVGTDNARQRQTLGGLSEAESRQTRQNPIGSVCLSGRALVMDERASR